MNAKVKHWLKWHAYQNIPLTREEGFELGEYVLQGCVANDILAQVQSTAVLCALHNRATWAWKKTPEIQAIHPDTMLPEDAADQLAGIVAAVLAIDIEKSKFGFLRPNVTFAIDNCGMGGDLVVTPNVSTLAAFVAAAAGVPMCKHGSPANADRGKYGSSDFLKEICDIDVEADNHQVESCLEQFNFGYTEALDIRYKRIHLMTHKFAQLPHMNDIIGPMTNPLALQLQTHKIVGVNHLIPGEVVARAYQLLNESGITFLKRGFFVRGFVDEARYQGMDEVSICAGGTHVVEFDEGAITKYDIFAEDFGLSPVPQASITPDMNKGQYSLKILKGERDGNALSLVLANAALILLLAGKVTNLKDGFKMAKDVFATGRPYQVMLSVQKFVPR